MGGGCVTTLPVPSGAECHSPYHPARKVCERIGAELSQIWSAPNLKTATENLRFLVESYREKTTYLAKWLEVNVPEGLAGFTLQDHHRGRMRTSRSIERGIQQENKRRTRKVRVFPNIESLESFVSAVLVEIDENRLLPKRDISNGNYRMTDQVKSKFPDIRLLNPLFSGAGEISISVS